MSDCDMEDAKANLGSKNLVRVSPKGFTTGVSRAQKAPGPRLLTLLLIPTTLPVEIPVVPQSVTLPRERTWPLSWDRANCWPRGGGFRFEEQDGHKKNSSSFD